ncbi:MAG: hypothetical protein INR65_20995, partial [Gluconacetobacter diazotrophicus]|nr:hypothetical protein [Gluconacetobacter diazotrophicus]
MRVLLRYLWLAMAFSSAIASARAAELDGTTSCADYLRMASADTAPGADPAATRAHVTSLMREYAP